MEQHLDRGSSKGEDTGEFGMLRKMERSLMYMGHWLGKCEWID